MSRPSPRLAWPAALDALHALPVVAVLAASAAAAPASAASARLSDGLPFSDVGRAGVAPTPTSVDLPAVSPDGRWVVYVHDAEVDEAYELWRVAVAGGAPARLSGLLPADVRAAPYRFTPDGQRVIYRAQQDDLDAWELYSAPIAAPPGSWVKLNEPLPPGWVTSEYGVSADSAQVVYVVYESGSTSFDSRQLWVAATDGSDRLELVDLPAGRALHSLAPAPDFSRIAYVSDATVDERFEAWSVPTAGGTPQKLNGALAAGGDVQMVHVSPDSTLALYVADQQTDGQAEVYVVPITGGAADKVSAPLPAGQTVALALFLPTGGRILYAVLGADDQVAFWSVGVDGTDPLQLTPAMVAGGTILRYLLDADGSRLLYLADQQTDEVFELYSVPTAGGAAVKLSGTLVAGGDVAASPWPRLTPDGARVLFLADKLVDGRNELWSAPIDGSAAAVRLNAAGAPAGSWEVLGFAPNADGSRAAYTYRSRPCGACVWTTRLYSAPIAGGPAVRLDACPTSNANVFDFPVGSTVDPRQAFYLADEDADEQFELHVGDTCLLCDGFEAGDAQRWSGVVE